MHVLATILALFLAVAMAVSAAGKLTRMEPVVQSLDTAKVPHAWFPFLAAVQLLGALGLVVGIFMAWAGVAAGIGFAVYFALAAMFHVRAGDAKGAGVPVFLGVLGLLAAVFRALA